MPLGAKFRKLRDLKRRPDGTQYDISEIAREASRLYRERKIFLRRQELEAAGASADEISQACGEIQSQRDVIYRSFLSELKDGKRPNPPFSVIEALSLFFEVPTDFFRIGADATEETRQAEKEVELIELTVRAARLLNGPTESDDEDAKGTQLAGALMRGLAQGTPQQAEGVLRLALQALELSQKNPSG